MRRDIELRGLRFADVYTLEPQVPLFLGPGFQECFVDSCVRGYLLLSLVDVREGVDREYKLEVIPVA